MFEKACPNCGFLQEGGDECLRCGIIFAKFRQRARYESVEESQASVPFRTRLYQIYRTARWVALAISVVVLALILLPTRPPAINFDYSHYRQAASKIRVFQKQSRAGQTRNLDLDQSELNAWMDNSLNLGEELEQPTDAEAAKEIEEFRTTINDLKIELIDNRIKTFVRFDLYGKEMTFVLEAEPNVKDGYLDLVPVSGKIGSMPIPGSVLKRAIDRKFANPEEKEKLKLPPFIKDISVINGKLRVTRI